MFGCVGAYVYSCVCVCVFVQEEYQAEEYQAAAQGEFKQRFMEHLGRVKKAVSACACVCGRVCLFVCVCVCVFVQEEWNTDLYS